MGVINTTEDIAGFIDEANARFADTVKRAEYERTRSITFFNKLKEVMPVFEESIMNNYGLVVNNLRFAKTGTGEKWEPRDKMKISITARPVNNKFKFVKCSSGHTNANKIKLSSKSLKMREQIAEDTGIDYILINPFSLELREDTDLKDINILIEFWLVD